MKKQVKILIGILLVVAVAWVVIIHKDVLYKSQLGDPRCHDTIDYQAFYSIHTGIEYCFYRKTVYPYRVWGGVIGVKE